MTWTEEQEAELRELANRLFPREQQTEANPTDLFNLKRPGSDGDSRYLIPTSSSRSAWTA